MVEGNTRRKACTRCTRGKRKCDLQHPACGRCRARHVECNYTSTRLHHLGPPTTSDTLPETQQKPSEDPWHYQEALNTLAPGDDDQTCPLSAAPQENEVLPDLDRSLIAPESWQILSKNGEVCDLVGTGSLMAAVKEVQQWLRSWPSTGSLLFNHPTIYGEDRMPTCMQDAYTSCAAYFASCERTKPQLWRIIERNVNSLLHGLADDAIIRPGPCCLVYHLARCQALLIYQTIRLFDGDIRQRAEAEKLSSTVNEWGHEMVACALESSNFVKSFSDNHKPDHNAAWQAWCLAESIRRTWVTCNVMQGAYFFLKGDDTKCPGHLKFTAQMGLWDARSCRAWMEAQRLGSVLLYETMNGKNFAARARAGEFDEFGQWALRLTTGGDPVVA